MHVLLHSAIPGLLAGLAVLAIAWRSQALAFVAMLLLLVCANSSISWLQDPALAGRWGGLTAVAASVVWTLPLRWRARPQRGLAILLAVFLGYALVSAAWSSSPHWTVLRTVSFGVLLWTVFAGIRPALLDEVESRRLATGIVGLLAVVVAASVAYWLVDPDAAAPANQLRGIFQTAPYLALLIGLTYPLVLAQFDGLPRRAYAALSLGSALACTVVIDLCQSRAGLVAFVLAALAYELARHRVLRATVPLVAVAASSALFHLWHPTLTSGHAPFVQPATLAVGQRAPGQSTLSALLSGRDEVWSATSDLIAARPVAGYGFGTADRVLRGRHFPHFAGITPHDAYLQITLELGALGALLLLAPLALGLKRVLGLVGGSAAPPEVAAFGAVLLGGLLDGIFEDVFEAAGSPFAPLVWLSCAVVLVRVRQRAPSRAVERLPVGGESARAYHPTL